jgi:hypothetical protein
MLIAGRRDGGAAWMANVCGPLSPPSVFRTVIA